MILKLIIGNAIFAGIVWGYYVFLNGNRPEFLRGAVAIGIGFFCGTITGAWLNRPAVGKSIRRGSRLRTDLSAFDHIA